MDFPLGRLPPEVRQLIWEATLPDQRVFHVSKLSDAPARPQTTDIAERRAKTFSFHVRHPPPAIHGICRESRAMLLLRGYFLPCGADTPSTTGPWFNPQRDVLYFDRNMRYCLKAKTALDVDGLERVRHVGLEWRAWFRDVPRLADDGDMHQRWAAAMRALLRHCPRAESMSFVLPRVRHVGGIPSGREPYRAEHHRCDLTRLPEGVQVPWARVSVQTAPGALTGTALAQLGGESRLVPWRDIRQQMETAVSLLQGHGKKNADCEGYCEPASERAMALRVRGWWLVRPGAPTGHEEQDVREYWS
ncbi:hypothetical protein A9K55_002732 [Cordyceps militaris]|uniref:2EXR domain-containing protein n=1 Tax=Cordyceps militaris TaxID=73501 RepID=A0A2H4S5R9_CORMI|nr:hypothetical protein A9K55_002732 [Cordyceps militaris]